MTTTDKSVEIAAAIAAVYKTQGFEAARRELHRLAAEKPAKDTPWRAWRVASVDIQPDLDGLARVLVYCDPVASTSTTIQVFEFMAGTRKGQYSERLNALAAAAGMRGSVEDEREIEGRYFAARNDGRTPYDFAPLGRALQ